MTSTIPGRWLAACLAFSVLATGLMLLHAHQTIVLGRAGLALILGGGALAAIRYGWRDPDAPWQRVARDAAEYVGGFALVCLLGAMISYPEAASTHGFVDPSLERIDRFFRFNWVAWYEMVAAHPALQALGRAAYQGIFVSPAILLAYCALADDKALARRLTMSFWIGAMLTLIWFPRVPAVGPLAFLWHGPIPYMPTSALYQAQLLPALRDHTLAIIDLGALRGIVCVPSFHTTSAILYIAAAWRIRALRIPLLALNVAMLLATPVEGTHYLADMLGGALVAAIALVLTTLAETIAAGVRTAVPSRLSV